MWWLILGAQNNGHVQLAAEAYLHFLGLGGGVVFCIHGVSWVGGLVGRGVCGGCGGVGLPPYGEAVELVAVPGLYVDGAGAFCHYFVE